MSFRLCYAADGLWYGQFSHFPDALLSHGVSTRLGGVSASPYASLNLALHVGDDAAAARRNRALFCQSLGMDAARLVTAEQVHGDQIVCVDEKNAGQGALDFAGAVAGADALITATPRLPLALFFADCAPVLIADPRRRVVAVSHAGWRGTAAKIAQKTVLAMQARFAVRPEDCLVGVGPSIGPACYEVDEAVMAPLRGAFPRDWRRLAAPQGGGKWRLDLWEANRVQLTAIGVREQNIRVSQVCTHCNTALFFSYRAEQGRTGRIAAAICLR